MALERLTAPIEALVVKQTGPLPDEETKGRFLEAAALALRPVVKEDDDVS